MYANLAFLMAVINTVIYLVTTISDDYDSPFARKARVKLALTAFVFADFWSWYAFHLRG